MKKRINLNETHLKKIINSVINESSGELSKTICVCPPGYKVYSGCNCIRTGDPDGTVYK